MRLRSPEIAKRTSRFVVCLAVFAVTPLCTVATSASEIVIPFPEGWKGGGTFGLHCASAGSMTVVTHQSSPSGVIQRSLVIQREPSGTIHDTEFDGKVFAVMCSPDGQYTLAHQIASPDLADGSLRVHLLTATGTTVWSRVDPARIFDFSATGEAIFAWYPGDIDPNRRGEAVETLTLGGATIQNLAVRTGDVRGGIVPDDGQDVIFVTSRAATRWVAGDPPVAAWRFELPAVYPEIVQARLLKPNLFVLELAGALKVLLTTAGTLVYTFDPPSLGASDPRIGVRGYASYRFFSGANGKVALFNGAPDGWVLEIASGLLTKKTFNVNPPSPNHALVWDLQDQMLFFASEDDFVARAIE